MILGATLPLGAMLTRRLVDEGKAVRALVLNADRAQEILPRSVSMTEIEPTRESITDACEGAAVIYDLFEPQNMKQLKTASEVASSVLLAGIRTRAKTIIASHLFISEKDNKGFETEAMSTHWSNFAKVAVVRFPQLFGPEVRNALFDNIYEEVLAGNKAHWMGKLDARRSLLFIEDAVGAIQELENNDTAFGYVWNIAGPAPLSGKEFIENVFRAAGKKNGGATTWGRGLMITARFLDSKAKGFLDLPYDNYSPFVIDGSPFAQAFPTFAFTPNETAIRMSLEWYRDRMKENVVTAV